MRTHSHQNRNQGFNPSNYLQVQFLISSILGFHHLATYNSSSTSPRYETTKIPKSLFIKRAISVKSA